MTNFEYREDGAGNEPCTNLLTCFTVRARLRALPGCLSGFSVLHSMLYSYGGFVWSWRVLNASFWGGILARQSYQYAGFAQSGLSYYFEPSEFPISVRDLGKIQTSQLVFDATFTGRPCDSGPQKLFLGPKKHHPLYKCSVQNSFLDHGYNVLGRPNHERRFTLLVTTLLLAIITGTVPGLVLHQ